MTTQELINYYVNLLIIQYHDRPKAMATINALAAVLAMDMLLNQVQDGFDVATAVGAQLDILIKYVGGQRNIYSIDLTKTYFQFRDQADPAPPTQVSNGFADQASPNTPWYWLTPQDLVAVVTVLTDGQMRQLIQYLARVENMDFSMKNIDDLFFDFFGIYVTMADNQDMTMTVTHNATLDPSPLFRVITELNKLPHPAGVGLTVVTI